MLNRACPPIRGMAAQQREMKPNAAIGRNIIRPQRMAQVEEMSQKESWMLGTTNAALLVIHRGW